MMDFKQALANARETKDYNGFIENFPYAKLIGVECFSIGNELFFKLKSNDSNMGNPSLPAIHGGVTGGFMETAAMLHVMLDTEALQIPKVVDFSIDYLQPARIEDTFAECNVVRQGRKTVNVMVNAWQDKKTKPIARARAHFLLK